MIAQFLLVTVASSAVHARHVNVDTSYYDQFSANLGPNREPEGYLYPESSSAPKTNLQHNVDKVKSDYYISERSQKLRISPMPIESSVRDLNSDVDVKQHARKHSDINEQLANSKAHVRDGVYHINYTEAPTDSRIKNTQGQGHEQTRNDKRYDALSKHERNFTYRNVHTNHSNMNINLLNRNDQFVEPVTERKPFTNAPNVIENKTKDDDVWIWSDKGDKTSNASEVDLEDRAIFNASECATGQGKVAGTNICVDKH